MSKNKCNATALISPRDNVILQHHNITSVDCKQSVSILLPNSWQSHDSFTAGVPPGLHQPLHPDDQIPADGWETGGHCTWRPG